jgi:hypothetical protein
MWDSTRPVQRQRRPDLRVGPERRDFSIRPERDAVAAFFGIHPVHLAALAPELVEVMAYRVQGDRRHWLESATALVLAPTSTISGQHRVA